MLDLLEGLGIERLLFCLASLFLELSGDDEEIEDAPKLPTVMVLRPLFRVPTE